MRLNQGTALVGSLVRLVPYRREMVATYHAWMQDDELLALTASEKLSIEEEYENCESWQRDETKITFILEEAKSGAMVGDCNAFYREGEAEVEVMIAEPKHRRKGIAEEALRIFLTYLSRRKPATRYVAKIAETNRPSLALFEKKLGFQFVRKVDAFSEIEMELVPTAAATKATTNAHYAECAADAASTAAEVGDSILAQTFEVETFDKRLAVALVFYGKKSVVVLCGDDLGSLCVAAPATFGNNDIAATSLLGDSQVAAGIARRLSAKTGRLVFLAWADDDAEDLYPDESIHVTLEAALGKRIPPAGWLPHPNTTNDFFSHEDTFASFDDLRQRASSSLTTTG